MQYKVDHHPDIRISDSSGGFHSSRMEYDEEAEILRVYGPFEVKEWNSVNKEYCYDTISPDPSYNVWIDLLPYYEEFVKLMEELETRSGKRIIRKTGSCSSVKTKEDR